MIIKVDPKGHLERYAEGAFNLAEPEWTTVEEVAAKLRGLFYAMYETERPYVIRKTEHYRFSEKIVAKINSALMLLTEEERAGLVFVGFEGI